MMNIKRFILLLILIISAKANAQILASDSLSRIINVRALALISDYERIIYFKHLQDTSDFCNLFHNKKALVFNDVMPDNNLSQKINIFQYSKLIRKYYSDNSFLKIVVSPY